MLRTNTCGELTKKDIKKTVRLCGWAHSRRDHGGVIFIDLRDRYGLTQVVFDPSHKKELHKAAEHLGREDVLFVEGKVRLRPEGMINPKLKTGQIEVLVDKLEILNKSKTPPIEIEDRVEAGEETRLKYRYLDLRRPLMQKNLFLRHKAADAVREYFNKNGFIEIETPMLVRSTPEGARDYIVPSRNNPGFFYALPQSPQLYKQILMMSGFERYYQLARCLRDEDLRTDRQPEFTQIDVEMSFVEEEDIHRLIEGLMKHLFKNVLGIDLKIPFSRITHEETMDKYGTDRPDTRFGLELIEVTDIVKDSDFEVFKNAIKKGGIVKCINAAKYAATRKEIEELTAFAAGFGAKGLAWMRMEEKLESSILKYFDEKIQDMLIKKTNAKKGDLLLFIADEPLTANIILSNLRTELAKRLNLIDNKKFNFIWITDFPLVEYSEEEQKHVAVHHPFTSPKEGDINLLEKETEKVKARAYDLTLNGVELGGGSIRIHKYELQEKVLKALGISKAKAEEKFGFLLNALKYGAPPHGGIALGFDRIVALMSGTNDIREVIAFPKNKKAESPMDNSPAPVDERQLQELHIKLDIEQVSVFENLKAFLDKNNVKYELLEHKPVYTSEEAAKVRGTELKQGARALLLECSGRFVLTVTSAEKEVDLEKLKKILNIKKIRLANPKEIERITKCTIGAVPPFGNLFNIETYVDKSLMENKIIAFNAGSHTKSVKMKLENYIKIIKPKIEEFSK